MSTENSPYNPGHVVIAYDATRDRNEQELKLTVENARVRGDILHPGDTLTVLGVLQKIPHPLGYQMHAIADSFIGANMRAMEEEVSKRVDAYVTMLLQSAEDCEDEGVNIEVKITAGTPIKKVVLQEVTTCNATWVILDRHLRRDLRFYLKQIPCKLALVQDNLSVEVLRPHTTTDTDNIEHKLFLSLSKPVPLSAGQDNMSIEQSVVSCRSYNASISSLENSDMSKTNLASSFKYRSRENSFSSFDDFGSTSKHEKSG